MKGEDLPDHNGELSEIAEIHSIVNVKVLFKEAKDITDKGQRFPLNGRCF